MTVSEHFKKSLRSVVSDLTEIFTKELVNMMKNAHAIINHLDRNNLDKFNLKTFISVSIVCTYF